MFRARQALAFVAVVFAVLSYSSGRSWGDGECPDTVTVRYFCPHEAEGQNLTVNCGFVVAADCGKFSQAQQQKEDDWTAIYKKGSMTYATPKYISVPVGNPPLWIITVDTKQCYYKRKCKLDALGLCAPDPEDQGEWVYRAYLVQENCVQP